MARTAPGNVVGPRTNFANGGFDRDHDRFRGGRFVRPAFGVFTFGRTDLLRLYDYDAADGCWQRRLVPTPYGLRWRLVDVGE